VIQPKFKIGQEVIGVHVGWLSEKVQCPDCLGTREWSVNLPSGEEFQHDCQTCRCGYYSSGFVTNYGDKASLRNLTIGSVQINTAEEKEPVRYMCVETGIGTGTLHAERTLFATIEEANAFAADELERVKGLRQAEEDRQRAHKKKDSLIHGRRKKA
jgi:hypothetical protein